MRKIILAGIAMLFATGCATQAQREYSRIDAASNQTKAASDACIDHAKTLPSYSIVGTKLRFGTEGEPSLDQRMDSSMATPEEVQALLTFHREGIEPCRKVIIDGAAKMHPVVPGILAEGYANADANYIKLVKREETWGDYITASDQNFRATKAKLAQAEQAVVGQLQASHVQEVQQRQAAAAALSNWAYQQQVIAAMNRPVTTNCTRFGYSVNCTSY